jgi:hypothetical protein
MKENCIASRHGRYRLADQPALTSPVLSSRHAGQMTSTRTHHHRSIATRQFEVRIQHRGWSAVSLYVSRSTYCRSRKKSHESFSPAVRTSYHRQKSSPHSGCAVATSLRRRVIPHGRRSNVPDLVRVTSHMFIRCLQNTENLPMGQKFKKTAGKDRECTIPGQISAHMTIILVTSSYCPPIARWI